MRTHEQKLLDALRPGARVFVSAGSAEPQAFAELLASAPAHAEGVNVVGSFVPGVNTFDYAALHAEARMTTLLLPGTHRASFEQGKIDVLPLSYTGFAAYLERRPPDIAVAHLTPPDDTGVCSLGVAADFAPIAWRRAGLRVAYINASMPRPRGGWALPLGSADLVIECDHPPLALPAASDAAELRSIARHVAGLIDDGACVQAGLGGAPAAALAALSDRRNLIVHSGMISDEFQALSEAGALASHGHVAGIAIGSQPFYDWVAQADGLDFAPTPATHGAQALAQRRRFTAINSALEIDLFGQANLEWRNGRLLSGIGGAPDFVAGAHLSEGGRSIVALPSSAKGRSRIVAQLVAPTVSIPRNLADVVVTEHGVAEIRDLPLERRAQALIAIAAPDHQSALQEQWAQLRGGL